MKRLRDSRSIMANTKEMREVAQAARRLGLNRQMTPAQYQLLDPKGTHVLSPIAVHEYADQKPVDPHMRVFAYLKLIGKHDAIERHLDVPFHFLQHLLDDMEVPKVEDLIKTSQKALVDLEEIKAEEQGTDRERERREVFELGDQMLEKEIVKREEEDASNMNIAYDWYVKALATAKDDGTVVSTKPAPLSREQMTEVFNRVAKHPNYKRQTITVPLQDGTTIEMQDGIVQPNHTER